MSQYLNKYEEYSNKIQLLRHKVIDDKANAEFLEEIPLEMLNSVIKESELKVENISEEEIKKYEFKYRVRIPDFVKYIMTEIGQSNLVCFWFFNEKKQINKPVLLFSYDFFHACLVKGVSADYLNDYDFDEKYDNHANVFDDILIQEVFESLDCNDAKYIIKLLPTGHGDCSGNECVILNESDNGIVVYTVGWNKNEHVVDGVTYWQYDYSTKDVPIMDYCLAVLQNRLNTVKNVKDLENYRMNYELKKMIKIIGEIFRNFFKR